ncbi:hypothetical protein MBEHAL_0672 [Halarchaeum acidiphilum MH1-52-1]|uniref:Uncharacterized protein n=1 Tax=Halarchaeum acidiphilum MH1-52-1 TaxID=1261545 RepID=U2YT47_9EURY|nr:hypothetical protein [Halarchaeum acidiphilum]GAD51912.1 hypothetical protein MBEHAL_0672 [Halarchaeum acidiphilum MH1-52-1]
MTVIERRLEPMSEPRRLVYGALVLVASIVVNRAVGLHLVLSTLRFGSATSDVLVLVFGLSFVTAVGGPMWFWIVRPLYSASNVVVKRESGGSG